MREKVHRLSLSLCPSPTCSATTWTERSRPLLSRFLLCLCLPLTALLCSPPPACPPLRGLDHTEAGVVMQSLHRPAGISPLSTSWSAHSGEGEHAVRTPQELPTPHPNSCPHTYSHYPPSSSHRHHRLTHSPFTSFV